MEEVLIPNVLARKRRYRHVRILSDVHLGDTIEKQMRSLMRDAMCVYLIGLKTCARRVSYTAKTNKEGNA